MSFRRVPVLVLVFLLGLATGVQNAPAAELKDLLDKLPDDANSLIIVNAEKAFASKFATEIGWKESYRKNFATSPLPMPPDAKLFVTAARMNFQYMTPLWEVAVVELPSDPSIEQVAKLSNGQEDEIAGSKVVLTPRGGYVAKLGPGLFGGRMPVDRQATARWLRDVNQGQQDHLSPYLLSAAGYTERVGTEIIMALDLADLLPPSEVLAAMEASEVIKGSSVSAQQAAQILSSVQGVTLGVRVTGRVFGALKVDVEQDPAPLSPIAKSLLLEVIGDAGAMIKEFHDWEVKVGDKTIVLEGELSQEGLRKLFSLSEIDSSGIGAAGAAANTTASKVSAAAGQAPAGAAQAAPTGAPGGGAPAETADQVAYLSQQYFNAVGKYLDGLKSEGNAVSIGQIGLWFNKYARKIDRLPTLNVDPDLVNYGLWVTEQLRNATAAIQGIGIQSAAREAQTYATVDVNNYGSGYGQRSYNWNVGGQRRAVRYEERAKGATSARGIMQEIRNAESEMRRKMTDKYKIQF